MDDIKKIKFINNYIFIEIIAIISIVFLVAIILNSTNSSQYLGAINHKIWDFIFCVGAIIALGGSLLVYWAVIKKDYHRTISNPVVLFLIFPVFMLLNYITIRFALKNIDSNYDLHIKATMVYFAILIVWDILVLCNVNQTGASGKEFRNYVWRLVPNDVISLIGIIVLFAITKQFVGRQEIIVGRDILSIPLEQILMSGAIGFQMIMSGLGFSWETYQSIRSHNKIKDGRS